MRIVVGVDEHSDAEALLSQVMQFARTTGAEIVLLNVIDPVAQGSETLEPTTAAAQACATLARDEESFSRLASAYVWGAMSLAVEPRRIDENVADCVARVCRRERADLVVVASRRAGTNALGSVARQLLRTSPCPVVVIRTGSSGNDEAE